MKIKHPIFGDIFPLSRRKETLVAAEKDTLSAELLDEMLHEISTYRLARLSQVHRDELFRKNTAITMKQNSAEAQ